MATVNFGPYEPDRGRANGSVLSHVNNVVPTEDGYAPLPAIIPTPPIYMYITYDDDARITFDDGARIIVALDWSGLSGVIALPDACIGFFAARKRDGSEIIFAGTETKLYRLDQSQFVWTDVSGMTYAAACRWSFEKFGDEVRCQNGFDFEQVFDLETDDVFSSDEDAPICKYLLRLKGFLFRFNIVAWDAESQNVGPNQMMCSALENPGDNIPQNANWCDFQAIPTGDEIMGAVATSSGAHVWLRGGACPLSIIQENGITFVLGDVDTSRGTSAPYSLCSFGVDRYVVYTDDGLWLYNGGFTPIGQGRINKTFLRNVDQSTFEDILAMNDPENAIIWVAFTNTEGDRRMMGYQYNIDKFTSSDVEVSASFVCRTFVYSESSPPILVANQPRFTVIDSNGRIGYMVGDALEAQLVTNELQFDIDRTFMNRAQLYGDPTPQGFTVKPYTRDVKGGAVRERPDAVPSLRSGNVPLRASGKVHQLQVDIAAGEPWTYVSGAEVSVKKAGRS